MILCVAGLGTLASMLLPSSLGKWGLQVGDVVLPAIETCGTATVQLRVSCYVRKVVWCKGRDNATQTHDCKVQKESSLHAVEQIHFPQNWDLVDVCKNVHDRSTPFPGLSGSCPGGFAVDRVGQFLHSNVSARDACDGIVKLL